MYATCVYPPALSSILVVAKVAELGKQVKKDDTVLEIPWASSSWNKTQVQSKYLTDLQESISPFEQGAVTFLHFTWLGCIEYPCLSA